MTYTMCVVKPLHTSRSPRSNSTRTDWAERTALAASALCLAHCLALPLLFAALPMLAELIALPESFHILMVAIAVPSSGFALIDGYSRHWATAPLVLGGAGLSGLIAGATALGGTSAETWVTVLASVTLAFAHGWNWRLRLWVRRNGDAPPPS